MDPPPNSENDGPPPNIENNGPPPATAGSILFAWFRGIFMDIPVFFAILLWTLVFASETFYSRVLYDMVESFRRSGEYDANGYFPDFFPDLTYYGRQCDASDITSTDSNDLLIPPTATSDDAAHIMMKHGAVMVPQLLSDETASELREYLESRHEIQAELPWHEKFWESMDRLSLGLGTEDHPVVAKALEEVGNNELLRTTVNGILGEDPAIVEISTLTTMHGAEDQGIHTDSDYFGSSLLYSRTFLHSYTLFMALQDTTSKMGATTVCPGTQWCANEDMSDVCHENGAFEVSSNGQTGRDVGVLNKGDGMMFNQNVWHRGPRNFDPEFPENRVMFILTFVSQRDFERGDVRQQGLGTYYYQRWNMWGHTFEDLKNATTVMEFPWRILRALGLAKLQPDAKWGITWLEHFARQLANHEDFFAEYELVDFRAYLDSIGVPEWFQQDREKKTLKRIPAIPEWEPFLKLLWRNAQEIADRVMFCAFGYYLIPQMIAGLLSVFGLVSGENRASANVSNGITTLFLMFVVIIHIVGGLWFYVVSKSHLGHRIYMRSTWNQPIPEITSMDHLTHTTYPSREDVLMGSRFDTPYLASFNRLLDYHPGNVRLQETVDEFPNAPPAMIQAYFESPVTGVVPRFLEQDWQTGFWSVMEPEAVEQFVAREVTSHHDSVQRAANEHLKATLAESRFGRQRDTVMSKHFAPLFVERFQSVLFGEGGKKTEVSDPRTVSKNNTFTRWTPSVASSKPVAKKATPAGAPSHFVLSMSGDVIQIGDRVLADYYGTGEYREAILKFTYSKHFVHVEFVSPGERGAFETVSVEDIQPFRRLVQGDEAEVKYEGEWHPAVIARVHPLGLHSIRYVEDGTEEEVPIESVRFPARTQVGSTQIEYKPVVLTVGQHVMGNFEGNDSWFPGIIEAVNTGGNKGTYGVRYSDGDYESHLPLEMIRPM